MQMTHHGLNIISSAASKIRYKITHLSVLHLVQNRFGLLMIKHQCGSSEVSYYRPEHTPKAS